MSTFIGNRKKFIKNLTVIYITGVDEKLIQISNLLHATPDGQRTESKPHPPSAKFVTAVPPYVYNYPSSCL